MFCMGCGAEVPPRAAVCPVCGRGTGRSGEARVVHASSEALEVAETVSHEHPAPSERLAPPALAISTAPAASGPSIGSGDLDQPGFPRDALGRSLIFTVLAMAADLLAPWVNLDGNRVAPSSLGLLWLVGLVWLGLAVLPLLRPSLRATPLYAAAPLVVGATSLGLGAAVWVRVTLLGAKTLVDNGGDSSFQSLGASSSADVGLYLFLAGAVVLIVAGYQIFLAAARSEARAELRAEEAAMHTPAHDVSPRGAAPPSSRPASDGRYAPAPAPTLSAVSSGAAAYATPSSRSLPLPPPTGPASTSALPDGHSAPSTPPAAGAHDAGAPGVALPGSAAWSQTPHTPDFQRPSPSLGWRHRG